MRLMAALACACATVLVGACYVDYGGNTTSTPAGAPALPPAPTDAVHSVSLPAIDAEATIARVVVRRYTGTEVPVLDPVTGARIGIDLQNKSEVFRYIQDIDLTTGADSIPIPDGKYYTLEVIAAGEPGIPRAILEYYKTNLFNVPTTATPVVFTQPDVFPRFKFPTIYAGLGPPYDTYTVTATSAGYPWNASKWTMVCMSYGPTGSTTGTVSSGAARFPAPPAGMMGALEFDASFTLDPSLLQPASVIANDPAKSWVWTGTYPAMIAPSTDVVVLPP